VNDSPSLIIERCLARMKTGDDSAKEELFQHAQQRLERLTRKMLNDYRGVRRWEETSDVLQNALVRLARVIGSVTPESSRQFYRLAAVQIRRELIDLARHHYGPQGHGAHHASEAGRPPQSDGDPAPYGSPDLTGEPSRLARWTEFHCHVELLPDDEREVFDLLWYQGLSQVEAAKIVGVSDRTIKSRWRNVRLKLYEALGGDLPEA
jgi:RNA polymerase sigma factor (sigma-70 family)